MPRALKRPHRAAVTRMLRATGLGQVPEEAPLVELLRTLADEMDSGGGSRVAAQFRGALKDARNVMYRKATERKKPEPKPGDPPPAPDVPPAPAEPTDLQRFLERRGIA